MHRNYFREKVGASDDLSLETLGRVAGLSKSRFMHVFTESVGSRASLCSMAPDPACMLRIDGRQDGHTGGA